MDDVLETTEQLSSPIRSDFLVFLYSRGRKGAVPGLALDHVLYGIALGD